MLLCKILRKITQKRNLLNHTYTFFAGPAFNEDIVFVYDLCQTKVIK